MGVRVHYKMTTVFYGLNTIMLCTIDPQKCQEPEIHSVGHSFKKTIVGYV